MLRKLGRRAGQGLLALAATMLLWASPAAAWWQKDWQYRKPVAVDLSPSGVNVSGALGRTLVLVRMHSGNFTFTDALDNGADIRFVDSDDKTPLPYHIESYDGKTGLATIWVSLPNLVGGEKKSIWLYFGNKSAPAGEDVKGSFDPDYLAVYHFRENPGQPSADSTANANGSQNAPAGVDDSGIIGRAARFPGQGMLTVAATPSLAMPAGSALTFSAWVKSDQPGGDQAILARGPMIIGLQQGVPYVAIGGASTRATQAVKQGDWTHVAVVADGKTVKIFVNGVEAGAASAALPQLDGPISLGGAVGRPFTGSLDEVRLSKIARPAAMLLAEAQGEGSAGKLVAVSETAEKQGGGGGVLFFIVSKVEMLDAVVIGVCLLMLVFAIAVMVSKARYINRGVAGNKAFMRRFRQMHEHLVPLTELPDVSKNERKAIGASPVAHLYDVGIEELMIRRETRGTRPLGAESIEAMRAAVDAVQVEENQKLDRFMVLLTIAISGGPFIGLLGTVMGVMSTFGGVAMAGDVNVNAIAPGIAAALLATIAGLSCAIPSLFGYNYLNSRIAAMADEMRVFVDRLITRLAEMQAELSEAQSPALMAAE